MTEKLKPYGSQGQSGLVTKVADPIKIDFFQPYGSSANGGLVAKVAVQTPKTPTPVVSRIRRLNAGVN